MTIQTCISCLFPFSSILSCATRVNRSLVKVLKTQEGGSRLMKCRYDWHQTPSTVVVSVFAKKYDPKRSSVQVNPIRLKINLHFPEEGSVFSVDLELRGIVDVQKCGAHMFPTKLEVKLQKAEPGSWSKLDFPRVLPEPQEEQEQHTQKVEELVPEVDAVDLSDL